MLLHIVPIVKGVIAGSHVSAGYYYDDVRIAEAIFVSQ